MGSFVTLLSCWYYISIPLSSIVFNYCQAFSCLVDAERLVQLHKTQPTVEDNGGEQLQVDSGKIKFDNVTFSYDKEWPIL